MLALVAEAAHRMSQLAQARGAGLFASGIGENQAQQAQEQVMAAARRNRKTL